MAEITYTGPLSQGRLNGRPFTNGVPFEVPDAVATRVAGDPNWSTKAKAKRTKPDPTTPPTEGTEPDPTQEP